MIIFGTTSLTGTKQKGNFNCPHCTAPQPFRRRRMRRFFHLYFIPLIPLDKLAEYIECQRCGATYDEQVLSYDPAQEEAAFMAEFVHATLRTMVMMMIADGEIDQNEVAVVKQVFQEIAGQQLTNDKIKEEIAEARRDMGGLIEYLQSTAPMLNDQGKGQVIRAAYRVAAADGHIDESELDFVYSLGEALDLSEAHLKGIIHEMSHAA